MLGARDAAEGGPVEHERERGRTRSALILLVVLAAGCASSPSTHAVKPSPVLPLAAAVSCGAGTVPAERQIAFPSGYMSSTHPFDGALAAQGLRGAKFNDTLWWNDAQLVARRAGTNWTFDVHGVNRSASFETRLLLDLPGRCVADRPADVMDQCRAHSNDVKAITTAFQRSTGWVPNQLDDCEDTDGEESPS